MDPKSLCTFVEEDPEEIIEPTSLKGLTESCKEAATKESTLTRKISRECDLDK